MDQPMPVLTVAAPNTVSAKQLVEAGQASPIISPWLILRIVVVALGLIGMVFAFQRKSRLAAAVTALCLFAGVALFFAGAGTASGLDAKNEALSNVLADSSLSQVDLGRQLFIAKGCVTCHMNAKIPRDMKGAFTVPIGTNLSSFSANPEVLFMRLKDPASVKSDTQMPNLDLTETEIEALIAFINSK
jgi:hypothetical protein